MVGSHDGRRLIIPALLMIKKGNQSVPPRLRTGVAKDANLSSRVKAACQPPRTSFPAATPCLPQRGPVFAVAIASGLPTIHPLLSHGGEWAGNGREWAFSAYGPAGAG